MKKNSFVPSLDGRLEDRIVMSHATGAGIVTNFPSAAVLTTRTYNNVLVNIHKSILNFERSQGTDADYARLSQNVGRQINRLPYAQQDGLTDYVTSSLQYYAPSEAKIAYSDLRSSVVSYLGYNVQGGQAAIRKSPGQYFSDSDIYGPNARIYNQPTDNGNGGDNGNNSGNGTGNGNLNRNNGDNGNSNGGNGVSSAAVLTTRTYNNVLVDIHKSIVSFGRSRGTDADYARLSQNVGRQINRLPYAQQAGLTDYVTNSLQYYAPSEAKIAYSDLRSTLVSYLSVDVQDGQTAIHKSPGHYFSDSDIYGSNARIYNQPTDNGNGNGSDV